MGRLWPANHGREIGWMPSLCCSIPCPGNPSHTGGRNAAIGVVCGQVTDQHAGVRDTVVGDGKAAVWRHHVDIEVDEPLAGDGSARSSHAVSRVAGGAAEAGADVVAVLIPARVLHDLVREIVTLAAQGVRPVDA